MGLWYRNGVQTFLWFFTRGAVLIAAQSLIPLSCRTKEDP